MVLIIVFPTFVFRLAMLRALQNLSKDYPAVIGLQYEQRGPKSKAKSLKLRGFKKSYIESLQPSLSKKQSFPPMRS